MTMSPSCHKNISFANDFFFYPSTKPQRPKTALRVSAALILTPLTFLCLHWRSTMGIPVAAFLFALLTCLQLVQTSPFRKAELDGSLSARAPDNEVADASNYDYLTKKGVNCLIAQDADCWDVLKMDDYVKAWIAGPRGQLCATQGLAGEFGDCFIDSYKLTPRCSTITVATCADGIVSVANDLKDSDITTGPASTLEKRQFFFAAYNIKAMSAFFYSWYTASQFAASATSDKIEKIVNVASPPPKATQAAWKSVVIDSLLAGLAFIPWTSTGSTLFSSTARAVKNAEAPGRVLLAASSGVYGHVFPNDGSAASDLIDIATLKQDLRDFSDDLQARLTPALEAAVNDVPTFLEMANTGAFSSPDPPSLPKQVVGLDQALTTYIISVALSSANWNGVVSPATDVNALLGGSLGHLNMDYGCSAVDPVTKICNAIWQDVPNNQGFTMVQTTSFLNNPYEKYQEYFGGEHWTTPELLLVGAAKCRLKPGWGTGVSITVENGDLNFDCLSQLKICTYNTACTEQQEGGCEYLESDCPAESGFGYDRDRYKGMPDEEATAGNSFFVPPGYMGPFRTASGLEYPLRGTVNQMGSSDRSSTKPPSVDPSLGQVNYQVEILPLSVDTHSIVPHSINVSFQTIPRAATKRAKKNSHPLFTCSKSFSRFDSLASSSN
ncbi:MAG: hypothetical protein Q9170_004258 [Blastenia crenularia]